jgi:hypothetical protein
MAHHLVLIIAKGTVNDVSSRLDNCCIAKMANYLSINKYINRCTTDEIMWMEWKEIAFQN